MKKLLFLVLTSLVAISMKSTAQSIIAGIVSPGNYYYDFDPDTSIFARPFHLGGPPNTVDVMIGSDNQCILRFYNWGGGGLGGGGGGATVFPLAGNVGFRTYLDSSMVFGGTYQYIDIADILELGDTIKAGQNYLFQNYCYFWSSAYGANVQPVNTDWVNIGDHYLGFTLIIPFDTVYGWVRINVHAENGGYKTTLSDFALNKNPWLGISESYSDHGIRIFPNPAKGMTTVTNDIPEKGNTLTIQNLLWQTLQNQPFDSGRLKLDISNLREGVYLMVISGNHGKQVRKLIVTK
jgi:hypothetical protein